MSSPAAGDQAMLNPTGIAWVGLFAADLPKLSDFYEHTAPRALSPARRTLA